MREASKQRPQLAHLTLINLGSTKAHCGRREAWCDGRGTGNTLGSPGFVVLSCFVLLVCVFIFASVN